MLTIVYCYNVKQKKQELVEHIIPWLVDLPSGYVRIVPYRATTTKRSRVAIYDSFYTWWHKRNTQVQLLGIRNIFFSPTVHGTY